MGGESQRMIVAEAEMFQAMLERASEDAVRRALAEARQADRDMVREVVEESVQRAFAAVGLHDEKAGDDVRDVRQFLRDWRAVKDSVLRTLGNVLVLGLIGLVVGGLYWHFRRPPS